MRAGLVALFEELLKRKMDQAAIFVQKHVRGFVKRRQFLRMKRDAVTIQCRIRRLLAMQLLKVSLFVELFRALFLEECRF